eukprot:scaffold75752_cov28-Phaeocystis_antarctica.AAC.1
MTGRYDGSDGGHTKWLSEASGLGASSESSHDQTEPSEREIRWTVKSAASVAADMESTQGNPGVCEQGGDSTP